MKVIRKYHGFFTFIIFILAALYITYPLMFHLGELSTGIWDELLIAWIHNWVFHSLLTNPLDIFNANIYYPYTNTLAYSDFFLVSSILGIIPFLLTNQPVAFINTTIIISLVTLGFSVYLLTHYFTKNFLASLLAGLLVIFSPAVMDKFVHIQILFIPFVPLAILFMLLFIQTKKTRFLLACIACFLLQTLNSFLPGYFIAFSIGIIFFLYFFNDRKKAKQLLTKKHIAIAALSIIILIPITMPYFAVSQEFKYVRDIRDTIHFALQPEDFFYTNGYSRLQPLLSGLQPRDAHPNADFKYGFIGATFTFLAIFAIFYYIKYFKKRDWERNSLFVIAIFGLLMSLGPFLHLLRSTIHHPFPIPLPYAVFYYIIPGFQGIRNSARWEMLFIIAIAIIVGIVFNLMLKKITLKKRAFIYLVLFVCVIAEFNFPITYQTVPQKKDFPAVYSWLNTTPKDTVIIEMPIYTWDMQPYSFEENMREYYSTAHFREMVNGASGFSPPPWQSMVKELLVTFPNGSSLSKLNELDIDYIIVHKDEYDILYKDKFVLDGKKPLNGEDIISILNRNKSVQLVGRFENSYVYKIIK